MRPSPKFPTSSAPLNFPKPAGASASPHGELSAPAGDQPLHEGPVVGEYVDESVTGPGYVVMQGVVLLGVAHVELAGQFLHVERAVAGRELLVDEQPARQFDRGERAVICLDSAGSEVGGI